MLPITILVADLLGNFDSIILVQVFNAQYVFSPLLSNFIIGGLWQLTIIFKIHGLIFTLIQFPNIANLGIDLITVASTPIILV